MMQTIKSTAKLNNGAEIPLLGLGVFKASPGRETRDAVLHALKAGYRHIDTAAMYGNERDVGEAVRESGIPREEVFITTKLWNSDHGYDRALRAFRKSLDNLGMDYVDLYLIHWPVEDRRVETWKALMKLREEKKCRAIGVSNFTIRHLEELLSQTSVVPAINQVEFSPFLYQKELLDYCKQHNIQLEAYSPLTRGRRLDHKIITSIAQKYDKTAPQVMIRWALQHDIVVIPKSVHREYIEQNADVFNFSLSDEDMVQLDSLNEDFRVAWDPSSIP